ncbi:hypothetical protein FRC07_008855 [Ceratobasidium sp. 392]|nr:hypothetical protein FRC07_008855 [Ceratobasidium sp. 392]
MFSGFNSVSWVWALIAPPKRLDTPPPGQAELTPLDKLPKKKAGKKGEEVKLATQSSKGDTGKMFANQGASLQAAKGGPKLSTQIPPKADLLQPRDSNYQSPGPVIVPLPPPIKKMDKQPYTTVASPPRKGSSGNTPVALLALPPPPQTPPPRPPLPDLGPGEFCLPDIMKITSNQKYNDLQTGKINMAQRLNAANPSHIFVRPYVSTSSLTNFNGYLTRWDIRNQTTTMLLESTNGVTANINRIAQSSLVVITDLEALWDKACQLVEEICKATKRKKMGGDFARYTLAPVIIAFKDIFVARATEIFVDWLGMSHEAALTKATIMATTNGLWETNMFFPREGSRNTYSGSPIPVPLAGNSDYLTLVGAIHQPTKDCSQLNSLIKHYMPMRGYGRAKEWTKHGHKTKGLAVVALKSKTVRPLKGGWYLDNPALLSEATKELSKCMQTEHILLGLGQAPGSSWPTGKFCWDKVVIPPYSCDYKYSKSLGRKRPHDLALLIKSTGSELEQAWLEATDPAMKVYLRASKHDSSNSKTVMTLVS